MDAANKEGDKKRPKTLSLHRLRYVPFALIACFAYLLWPLVFVLGPLFAAMLGGYTYLVIVLRRLDKEDTHQMQRTEVGKQNAQ